MQGGEESMDSTMGGDAEEGQTWDLGDLMTDNECCCTRPSTS